MEAWPVTRPRWFYRPGFAFGATSASAPKYTMASAIWPRVRVLRWNTLTQGPLTRTGADGFFPSNNSGSSPSTIRPASRS